MFQKILKSGRGNAKKRGMLSIEMIGVIAIIAIIVAGAAYYILTMNKDTKIANTIAGLNMIHTRATELNADFNTDANPKFAQLLYDTNNVPTGYTYANKSLSSPWGPVDFAPGTGSTDYVVTLATVPADICTKMMPKINDNNSPWTKIEGAASKVWINKIDTGTTPTKSPAEFCGTTGVIQLKFTGSK